MPQLLLFKLCKCGCGKITTKRGNQWRNFIHGHNGRGKPLSEETKRKLSKAKKGQKLTPKQLAWRKGVRRTPEQKKAMSKLLTGRKLTEQHKQNISNGLKGHAQAKGKKNKLWKGGYRQKGIPLYDTYAYHISFVDIVRRAPHDSNVLQVGCAYCGKFFTPKIHQVDSRKRAINGINLGENRFYCSSACKQQCPIFNTHLWPKGFKPATSREVQPELRQLVFKRDNWECQRCGKGEALHCHHFEGIRQNAIESADVDVCITLCKACHKLAHKDKGCRYVDMRCDKNKKGA